MTLTSFLLSAVMTLTIQTKSSVSIEGTAPSGMEARYACTYQKGDVRAGDTATLTLSGLEGLELEQVRLYVRSNKTAGAGVITIVADGKQLYRNEGTYKDWFGGYDNTNYQAIGWQGKKQLSDGSLLIQVIGTANSLHIEKYEITYTMPDAQAYSVTLLSDSENEVLTETEPGSGILLPDRADHDGWFFAGWAQSDISEQTEEKPDLLEAGERFFPKKDTYLWAVWTDVEPPTWERQTQPESGLYVLELGEYLLTEDVENGLMKLVSGNEIYTSDLYYLDFNTADTTCTIRNYLSNAYVGYDAGKKQLARVASSWHYRVLPDSTWLFIAWEEGDMVWILFQKAEQQAAWLHDYMLGDNPNRVWSLYRVPDPEQTPQWWSHPRYEGIEAVYQDDSAYVLRIGVYEIHIKNGKKTINLRK